MRADLAELIERVEKATGPDADLDRAIRDKLGLPAMLVPPDGARVALRHVAGIRPVVLELCDSSRRQC